MKSGYLQGLLLAGLLVMTGGCGTGIGPRSIGNERILYNEVLRKTQDEQLLLNLVRLRYNDTTQFLDLGSVVAQYGVETRTSAGVKGGINGFFGGVPADGGGATAGVEVAYQERPTVTYAPLQGENFANRMLTPIPLEVVVLLVNSGWGFERLTLVTMAQINMLENAVSASGPTPEQEPEYQAFQEYARTMRVLMKKQLVRLLMEPTQDDKPMLPPKQGESLEDKNRTLYVVLLPTQDPEMQKVQARVRELLGVPADVNKLRVTKSFYPRDNQSMAIRSRSLMGVLYFCSQSVEVPREHLDKRLAQRTVTADGKSFDWSKVHGGLLKIKSVKDAPEGEMLKVQYRGYWFYIDDTDADSKATFSLLQLIFSLQSTAGQGPTPLLTIPTN